MKKILVGLILAFASVASAELFTFSLVGKDGTVWDEVTSGVYTNVGAELTLEATLFSYLNGTNSPGSLLNSGASEFGINAAGAGDETLCFDTVNGQEAVWISFTQDVTIKSFVVSSFAVGNVETGAYQVASGTINEFTASGEYSGIDTVLSQGDYFKIIAIDQGGGNGWSLDSFSVEAVPEPATIAMLGLGSLLACLIRRVSLA